MGIVILAAIVESGCGGQSNSNEKSSETATVLNVSLSFSPNPIRLGSDVATVTVTDNSGKPVPGADVVIMTAMPAMKMNVPMRMPGMGHTGKTYRAKDLGDGTYRADIDVSMPTLWDFVTNASTHTAYGTAFYEAQVSGERR
jgi:hypothetical protein